MGRDGERKEEGEGGEKQTDTHLAKLSPSVEKG